MSTKESPLEKQLVDRVKFAGGECWKLTPPPIGIPDRLVILPGGFVAFAEVKRPDGKGVVSAKQSHCHDRLDILGARHYLIASVNDITQLIYTWNLYYGRIYGE